MVTTMIKQIASSQHPVVKHLVKLRQNRDYRYEHQTLVVEGIKPVEELGGIPLKKIVVCDETALPKNAQADEILFVTEAIMKKISGMQTSEGIIAEVAMPKPSSLKGVSHLLALDGVSDPGNVGALLRSALALGWQGAFILDESCDPFNEKAVRAARGATFRLPLAWGGWEELKEIAQQNRMAPVVADIEGKDVSAVKEKERLLLVMGNEAHGASPEAKAFCQAISIPMSQAMESLNVSVAGGIIMYTLGPKR